MRKSDERELPRPVIEYAGPSAAPRASALWTGARIALALPFALWGIWLLIGGVWSVVNGHIEYVAKVLLGVLAVIVAILAMTLPLRRRF
jgi:hypothetical protein